MRSKLTNEQARAIADLASELLGDLGIEVEAHEGYSGRGMYGEEVGALEIDSAADLLRIGFVLGYELGFGNEELVEILGFDFDASSLPSRIDDLGLGKVVY